MNKDLVENLMVEIHFVQQFTLLMMGQKWMLMCCVIC
jgi:hypothetical protein